MGDSFSTIWQLSEEARAGTVGAPVRRKDVSDTRSGASVRSSWTTVVANDHAEKPPIAELLSATRVDDAELDRSEVDVPAVVADGFQTKKLLVDAVADVELHAVDADDAVVLSTL